MSQEKNFLNKSKNVTEVIFKNKEEILNMHLPHIKFPEDFKIERTGDGGHFLVTKEGAPNKVSVIVDIGTGGKRAPLWEVMTGDLDSDSLTNESIDNYNGLINTIEKTFYFDPKDYLHRHEQGYFDDEENGTKGDDYGDITPEGQI